LRELARKYGDEVEAQRRVGPIPHRLPDPVPVAVFHLRSSMSDAQMADFATELAKASDRVIVNCFLTKVTVDGAAKCKTVSNVAGIWFRGADARLLTLLEGMAQLEELTFGNDKVTDSELAPLAKLPNLKVLEVSGDKLTPAAFAHLAGLKELRRFQFSASSNEKWVVTDEHVTHLKGLAKLEELDIGLNTLTDAGMAQLKSLTGLRIVKLGKGEQWTAAALDVIAGWPDLEELKLPYDAVAGKEFARLLPLKKLKKINLAVRSDQRRPALEIIGTMTSLEEFFAPNEFRDEELRLLAGLVNLRQLGLFGGYLTDAGLAHLKGMTRVQYLDLTGNEYTDAGLAHLKGMMHLQELNLTGNRAITDNGVAHLRGFVHLTTLHLSGTRVTDGSLAQLKDLPGLTVLWLDHTAITDAAVDALLQFPKLKKVYVQNTKVTRAAADRLREKGLEVTRQ
jgi:Leucine-rich repeat (LRR) protein